MHKPWALMVHNEEWLWRCVMWAIDSVNRNAGTHQAASFSLIFSFIQLVFTPPGSFIQLQLGDVRELLEGWNLHCIGPPESVLVMLSHDVRELPPIDAHESTC